MPQTSCVRWITFRLSCFRKATVSSSSSQMTAKYAKRAAFGVPNAPTHFPVNLEICLLRKLPDTRTRYTNAPRCNSSFYRPTLPTETKQHRNTCAPRSETWTSEPTYLTATVALVVHAKTTHLSETRQPWRQPAHKASSDHHKPVDAKSGAGS